MTAAISRYLLASDAKPTMRVVQESTVIGELGSRLVRTSQESEGYVWFTATTGLDRNGLDPSVDIMVGDRRWSMSRPRRLCKGSAIGYK
jgi:hypothetical protein